MITELAVERVGFTCGSCWHRWSVDYDVQRYRDALDAEWEVFYRDNAAVSSPYTLQGAPPCEHCGRRWVGRLVARRPVPLPGDAEAPRSRVPAEGADRPERHDAPMLHAAGHPQPSSGTRAAQPSTKPSG
ncbi:hypothetical protein [Streptomyces griseomycini]|uniref:Uncharacterized protein n=1 Tax=Streptomyces griseomycini TaxID=66895 RepID=A0A7W7M0S3_9ACTN|nr:hypothetical protein [Streptomyces griseomycini]MBB4899126.1 hypothetical protein [Streptomyces griseomycini]GGQ05800.1 hypothetical protein GCM10010266_31500 [Streptomyces griseomycini]GGR21149.1 hypothetical protein GCM10015536_28450 [Streptomyces griseomycini]